MTVGTIEKRRRRTIPAPAKPAASRRGWLWALLQIGLVGGEIFALLFLLAQPAFRPRHVVVVGVKHLSAAQVTDTLNLPSDRNVPAVEAGSLTVINRPGFGAARDGQHAVGSDLLPMLIQLRAGFTAAFKISVTSFQLDGREVLTAQTDRGWTIIFGQMVTGEDRASLEPKLAALRALSSRIDFVSAPIQYINLENSRAPAVQMRPHK